MGSRCAVYVGAGFPVIGIIDVTLQRDCLKGTAQSVCTLGPAVGVVVSHGKDHIGICVHKGDTFPFIGQAAFEGSGCEANTCVAVECKESVSITGHDDAFTRGKECCAELVTYAFNEFSSRQVNRAGSGIGQFDIFHLGGREGMIHDFGGADGQGQIACQ